ncbi:UDP-glucose--hexose-1-phosphate uridylyltransferase [Hymenobacter sp. 5516J-16]|uniref:UDP-glucose--hexose-1-phosphate uridylyltransferase n=1 Tax=Hymenobacter sp. 5516J-16 TaxID=2932253 RepID=UPI001FD48580|nr:UDP-glucose--hexose-1-phosphate uridylyltransferase [Hymenobacter sp. 5516J-16]UOQ76000.1 UDP-glucose--hexose-1-phosphate uridylyltransferase [Hymenobacter sp. 5516J-16]
MASFDLAQQPHRRFNPLTGEWLLVSPHRALRPWQGQQEAPDRTQRPAYDPTCYLCAGNTRANGAVNPAYTGTFVFDNDFAALTPMLRPVQWRLGATASRSRIRGRTGYLLLPRHDLTLPEMNTAEIRGVVDVWAEEFASLGARPDINYVQIFENKGQVMGCSNPHPHGQIWAQRTVPGDPAKETVQQHAYFQQHGRSLLADYLDIELKEQQRIVLENEHFVVLVPFWAAWPFETLVLPRRAVQDVTQLTDAERDSFADAIRRLTIRYDNLFQTSFPYSAGLHQRPTDGQEHPAWHLHMHFFPPLLRSATVRKFMVGYELLANPQRDITPSTPPSAYASYRRYIIRKQ